MASATVSSADRPAPAWSLESRLRRRLWGVLVLLWLAGAAIAWIGVRHETAEVLDISPATVKREWASARAWLFDAIEAPPGA